MEQEHRWNDQKGADLRGAREHDTQFSMTLAERHRSMIVSAGHRLAHELGHLGCPAPQTEIARRCGVDHWSQASLDEAVTAAEREGLLHRLPLGWLAPAQALGTDAGPRPLGRQVASSHEWPEPSGLGRPEHAQHGGRRLEPLAERTSRVES